MNTTTIISTWESIIQQFFPIFTAPTAGIFMSLVTGWVLCTARRTITRILPFADRKVSGADWWRDAAENPKYEKVLGELKEKLKAFQKRTKDPWIIKWQYE